MSRLSRIIALALLVPGICGCVPAVVWLPDSSGFIYTELSEKRPLIHFDLATKKSRVIVATVPATAQPGLDPDGKKIAVANYDDELGTLQLVIYDLQGKELERTKKFVWSDGAQANNKMPPAVYWSPVGDRILVSVNGGTGLYDVKPGTMKLLPNSLVAVIGSGPVRPDHAGFLLVKKNWKDDKSTIGYAFCDWKGKQQVLKTPAGLEDAADDVHPSILFVPSLAATRWDKNVAVVTAYGSTLELDTGKVEVRFKKGVPAKAADDLPVQARYPLEGGVELRSVALPQPKKNQVQAIVPTLRLELLLPGQKDAKVLMATARLLTATPSPNGEWLVLRSENDLVVVNRKGEVIQVPALGK